MKFPSFKMFPLWRLQCSVLQWRKESSYFDNPEQIRMMPLPSLVKTELPDGGYANLSQYEPLSTIPFPQIPQLQPDLLLSPESQELLARLDDPYFLSILLNSEVQHSFHFGPPLFDPVSGCVNSAADVANHVTPDTLFDEFPSDMFDLIEPLAKSFRLVKD
uniref:Uncharacterized protein n=1 Tax=Salix viminalis TaxID=40686 RepID=A0A6N2L7A6_SALVM